MRPRTPPQKVASAVKVAEGKYQNRPTAWMQTNGAKANKGEDVDSDMLSRGSRGSRKGAFMLHSSEYTC